MKKFLSVICMLLIALCIANTAPLKAEASVTTVITAGYSTLKYGAKGSAVKKLQTRLAYLGYYSGNIDGKYGPLTRSAVKSFQRAVGLSVNGTANGNTQKYLYSDLAPQNPNSISYSVKYIDSDVYYNISLTEDEQDYVRKICKKYNVSFELVLGVMKVESGYSTKLKSKTNDYGIMQINKCNHSYLSKKLGVNNFLDFEQNTKAGVYWLSRYTAKYSDIHKVLMCYNLGEGAAAKKWKKGTTQNTYSLKVVAAMEQLTRKSRKEKEC